MLFLARIGTGVGVAAALRAGGLDRVLAAGQAVRGRSPQEVAADEDYWYEIQQAFTVDRNTINMNNGTMQPSLRVVQDAMRRHYEFSANAGIHTTDYFSHDMEIVRRRLARHMGCSADELALTRGGSEAGQIAVMGIDLKPGDEVLTTDYDYPRFLNSLRQRELREGVVLRKIALPPPPVPLDLFYSRIEAGHHAEDARAARVPHDALDGPDGADQAARRAGPRSTTSTTSSTAPTASCTSRSTWPTTTATTTSAACTSG